MAKAWIVVANGSRARVFEARTPMGGLDEEVASLVHTQTRLREQGLTSDLPGRAFDRGGQGRHAMETKVSPRQHEKQAFAAEICELLERACTAGRFSHLIVAATPAFMGILRQKMGRNSSNRLIHTVEKDLTRYSSARIRAHLPDKLWMVHG